MRIGLLYDPHVVCSSNSDTNFNSSWTQQVLNEAITKLNGLSTEPDFTVIGGDLHGQTYNGSYNKDLTYPNHDCDFNAIKNNCLANFTHSYYTIPGNHDIPKRLFRKHFGETYFSFDQNSLHFIFLDTMIGEGENYHKDLIRPGIPSHQIEWLKNDLQASSYPSFIFAHNPFIHHTEFHDSEYIYNTYYRIYNYAEIKNIIESYGNVVVVNTGHIYPTFGYNQSNYSTYNSLNGFGHRTINGIVYTTGKHLNKASTTSFKGGIRWMDLDAGTSSGSIYAYWLDSDTQIKMLDLSW